MASDSSPEHYSPTQIVLHWIVVIGVITQLSLNEPIVRVIDAYRSGETPLPSDMTFAWIHVAVGSTVLLSVLGRLFLRVRRGVPKPVPGTTRNTDLERCSSVGWRAFRPCGGACGVDCRSRRSSPLQPVCAQGRNAAADDAICQQINLPAPMRAVPRHFRQDKQLR
jgi:hypothetical protein